MEKESEEKVDTRPRRPRRPREEDIEPKAEEKPRPEEKATNETHQAKPRRRRREIDDDEAKGDGGWMGASDGKKKFEPEPSEIETEKDVMATQNKDKHFNEDENDIMIIPDLDEEGGDTDARVAHAPRNVSRKIPNLNTLQNEAKNSLQTNKDGIDLSILLGTLVPPNMLAEEDSLWTFDSLLRVCAYCGYDGVFSLQKLQEVTEELNASKSISAKKQ